MKQRIVIALGGNAVQKQNEGGTYEEQAKNIIRRNRWETC